MMMVRDAIGGIRSWLSGPSSEGPFQTTRARRWSAVLLFGFLTVLGLWAAFVPLSSAVIASGVVAVESKRKKVQHLEGGIVERVDVRDGDTVKAGQVLAVLNQTETSAALGVLQSELDSVGALEARLQAEAADAPAVTFTPELTARKDSSSAKAAMEGQATLFVQRRQSLESQISVMKSRKAQYLEMVSGLQAQLAAVEAQTSLIDQETAATQKLFDQGLSTLPRVLALKRAAKSLAGQRGELAATIAQNKLKASEIDMQILELKNERLDKISTELRETERRRFELSDRAKAAKALVGRMTIAAPAAGVVVASVIHSPGQVVRGGEILLEIVPQDARLIVEAQLKPEDADNVRAGSPANVRLIHSKSAFQPVVPGKVISVSADRLVDARTGVAYYQAEIEVDRAAVAAALGDEKLQPGLPAEVMIGLGSHTALEYLLAPLNRSLQRAMREE
ncbi:MAG: HlyD family type I secretion periplasmic adaptor subunit [Micropepsaceae bacterium]